MIRFFFLFLALKRTRKLTCGVADITDAGIGGIVVG